MPARARLVMLILWTAIPLALMYAQNAGGSAAEQWVRHYPDVDTNRYGVNSTIVADSAGNVFITGVSRTPGGNTFNLITKKINPSGNEVWQAQYTATDDPSPRSIRVEKNGNVYVGAQIYGNAGGIWMTAVKIDAQGNTIWVVTYSHPLDSAYAFLSAMDVGPSGELYLTGGVSFGGLDFQYTALVKYDQAGAQQWARVDSLVKGQAALAVSPDGSVYLGGVIQDTTIVVLSYDSSGTLQWMREYDPKPSVQGAHFVVSQLDVDSLGNVYLATNGYSQANGSAGSYIYCLGASGALRWVHTYDANSSGGGMIGVGAKSIFVSDGYVIASYSMGGLLQWSVSTSPDSTFVTGIQPLVDGGVLFAGYNDWGLPQSRLGRYNDLGTRQWIRSLDGVVLGYAGLATDLSGNATLLATNQFGNGHPAVARFDSSGTFVWMEPGCYGCLQQPTALAADRLGNACVTGWSHSIRNGDDFLTMSYKPSGTLGWSARYNGPADSTDRPLAVAVDGHGNVYVTGESQGSGTGFDYATIKYDPSGIQQWIARYNGPAFGDDIPAAIAVDSSGYVYVTGTSPGLGTGLDYATVKYTPNGLLQWAMRYNGPSSGTDQARAIAVDPSGNVYVSGSSDSTGNYADYLTVKYNTLGQLQWTARYNGSPGGVDQLQAMTIDTAGNVYVTGWSDGVGTQIDYATVKYNAAGVQQWASRYDDPASSFDYALAVAVDHQGDVYVTGSSSGAGTGDDYTTVMYNSLGEQQWAALYDGPAHSNDVASRIAVDRQGGVYVTGQGAESIGDEASTIKYDPTGGQQWTARYSSWQSPPNERPVGLALDEVGDVFIASASGYAGGSIWSIIKYTQPPPVAAREDRMDPPLTYRLDQNYPNPFNPSTVISYQLSVASRVRLAVCDILGREVATLVNEVRAPGSYTVTWNASGYASGVYFYRLQAGTFSAVRKLLLLR